MIDLFVLFDYILNVIYMCVVGEELNSSSHNKVLFCSVPLLRVFADSTCILCHYLTDIY